MATASDAPSYLALRVKDGIDRRNGDNECWINAAVAAVLAHHGTPFDRAIRYSENNQLEITEQDKDITRALAAELNFFESENPQSCPVRYNWNDIRNALGVTPQNNAGFGPTINILEELTKYVGRRANVKVMQGRNKGAEKKAFPFDELSNDTKLGFVLCFSEKLNKGWQTRSKKLRDGLGTKYSLNQKDYLPHFVIAYDEKRQHYIAYLLDTSQEGVWVKWDALKTPAAKSLRIEVVKAQLAGLDNSVYVGLYSQTQVKIKRFSSGTSSVTFTATNAMPSTAGGGEGGSVAPFPKTPDAKGDGGNRRVTRSQTAGMRSTMTKDPDISEVAEQRVVKYPVYTRVDEAITECGNTMLVALLAHQGSPVDTRIGDVPADSDFLQDLSGIRLFLQNGGACARPAGYDDDVKTALEIIFNEEVTSVVFNDQGVQEGKSNEKSLELPLRVGSHASLAEAKKTFSVESRTFIAYSCVERLSSSVGGIVVHVFDPVKDKWIVLSRANEDLPGSSQNDVQQQFAGVDGNESVGSITTLYYEQKFAIGSSVNSAVPAARPQEENDAIDREVLEKEDYRQMAMNNRERWNMYQKEGLKSVAYIYYTNFTPLPVLITAYEENQDDPEQDEYQLDFGAYFDGNQREFRNTLGALTMRLLDPRELIEDDNLWVLADSERWDFVQSAVLEATVTRPNKVLRGDWIEGRPRESRSIAATSTQFSDLAMEWANSVRTKIPKFPLLNKTEDSASWEEALGALGQVWLSLWLYTPVMRAIARETYHRNFFIKQAGSLRTASGAEKELAGRVLESDPWQLYGAASMQLSSAESDAEEISLQKLKDESPSPTAYAIAHGASASVRAAYPRWWERLLSARANDDGDTDDIDDPNDDSEDRDMYSVRKTGVPIIVSARWADLKGTAQIVDADSSEWRLISSNEQNTEIAAVTMEKVIRWFAQDWRPPLRDRISLPLKAGLLVPEQMFSLNSVVGTRVHMRLHELAKIQPDAPQPPPAPYSALSQEGDAQSGYSPSSRNLTDKWRRMQREFVLGESVSQANIWEDVTGYSTFTTLLEKQLFGNNGRLLTQALGLDSEQWIALPIALEQPVTLPGALVPINGGGQKKRGRAREITVKEIGTRTMTTKRELKTRAPRLASLHVHPDAVFLVKNESTKEERVVVVEYKTLQEHSKPIGTIRRAAKGNLQQVLTAASIFREQAVGQWNDGQEWHAAVLYIGRTSKPFDESRSPYEETRNPYVVANTTKLPERKDSAIDFVPRATKVNAPIINLKRVENVGQQVVATFEIALYDDKADLDKFNELLEVEKTKFWGWLQQKQTFTSRGDGGIALEVSIDVTPQDIDEAKKYQKLYDDARSETPGVSDGSRQNDGGGEGSMRNDGGGEGSMRNDGGGEGSMRNDGGGEGSMRNDGDDDRMSRGDGESEIMSPAPGGPRRSERIRNQQQEATSQRWDERRKQLFVSEGTVKLGTFGRRAPRVYPFRGAESPSPHDVLRNKLLKKTFQVIGIDASPPDSQVRRWRFSSRNDPDTIYHQVVNNTLLIDLSPEDVRERFMSAYEFDIRRDSGVEPVTQSFLEVTLANPPRTRARRREEEDAMSKRGCEVVRAAHRLINAVVSELHRALLVDMHPSEEEVAQHFLHMSQRGQWNDDTLVWAARFAAPHVGKRLFAIAGSGVWDWTDDDVMQSVGIARYKEIITARRNADVDE